MYTCVRRVSVQIVSDVEATLLSAFSSCQSSVACQLTVVRSLGNARLPGSVDTLVELAVKSSHAAVSEAAFSSLSRFDADIVRHSDKVSQFYDTGVSVARRLGRWTSDLAVMGSIPGRGLRKSPRSTQPSIPPG